jgi:AraC family transcriptional regulator of arabinose operon
MVENINNFPEAWQSDSLSRDDGAPDAAPLVSGRLRGGSRYGVWRSKGRGDWLLLYTLSGRGRASQVALEPGDIALVRPGVAQDYGTARGAAGWEILWAHFHPRPHWRELLEWPEAAPGIGVLTLEGESRLRVEAALGAVIARGSGPLARRADFAMLALEEALLWCETFTPAARRLDERVEAAMAFMLADLGRPLALPEIAAAARLSVSRLSHLFRNQVGCSPMRYLESERLLRARQLLQLTTRPIASIASEVGFDSPIHFSLRFRKLVGVSPRLFRKQVGITSP